MFFFFKQKTAFEMRISDWSSDVCSSDLIVWTLVPVLILLGIAYPSLDLLAKQFKPAPADAVTVKATGYQWYWGYTYPDHGGFEVVSNMLKEIGRASCRERVCQYV